MGAVLGSEKFAVLSCIDPDAYTAAAYNGDVIDMSLWDQVTFIVMAGTLGSSATLDFAVKSDSASGGSYATTVKAITQLTDAGTDSDKQVIVNIRAEDLAEGQRYIRGTMTVGVATSDCGTVAIGHGAKYGPASDNDLASVDEIVSSS